MVLGWVLQVRLNLFIAGFQQLLITNALKNKQTWQVRANAGSSYLEDLHGHLSWRWTRSIWRQRDRDGWSGVSGPQLGGSGLLLRLPSFLLLGLFPHQLLPKQHPRRHGWRLISRPGDGAEDHRTMLIGKLLFQWLVDVQLNTK